MDRSVLRLAVSNVLDNAIKYTPRGGSIEVAVTDSNDVEIAVTITDNGPGIPPSEREKVFERFYRPDKARSRGSGGAGLGLAIARWAVETGGGSIAFIDPPGASGCRCRIKLPAADAP